MTDINMRKTQASRPKPPQKPVDVKMEMSPFPLCRGWHYTRCSELLGKPEDDVHTTAYARLQRKRD